MKDKQGCSPVTKIWWKVLRHHNFKKCCCFTPPSFFFFFFSFYHLISFCLECQVVPFPGMSSLWSWNSFVLFSILFPSPVALSLFLSLSLLCSFSPPQSVSLYLILLSSLFPLPTEIERDRFNTPLIHKYSRAREKERREVHFCVCHPEGPR